MSWWRSAFVRVRWLFTLLSADNYLDNKLPYHKLNVQLYQKKKRWILLFQSLVVIVVWFLLIFSELNTHTEWGMRGIDATREMMWFIMMSQGKEKCSVLLCLVNIPSSFVSHACMALLSPIWNWLLGQTMIDSDMLHLVEIVSHQSTEVSLAISIRRPDSMRNEISFSHRYIKSSHGHES